MLTDMKLFTRKGYRQMLVAMLKQGYRFLAFDSLERFHETKACLLRHDVDADLKAALEVSRIERTSGIQSTYFIMLRSPLYNPFFHMNEAMIREISSYHWIGLHYHAKTNAETPESVEESIYREVNILETMLGISVSAVSFHQPTPVMLSGNVRLKGLINTYNKEDLPGFFYISDSNKSWASGNQLEVILSATHPKLQLLIHPMWWCTDTGGMTTEEMWDQAVLNNAHGIQDYLARTEGAYGGKRTFRILKEPKL